VPFLGLRYRRHDNNEITYHPKAKDPDLPPQTGADGFEVPFDLGDAGTFSLEGFPDKPAFENREEAMGLVKRLQFSVTRPVHDLVAGQYQGKRTYGRPDRFLGANFVIAIDVSIAEDRTGSLKIKTDFGPKEKGQWEQTLFQGHMELNPEKTDLELPITRNDTQHIATVQGWPKIWLTCHPRNIRLGVAANSLILDWERTGEWFTVHLNPLAGLDIGPAWLGQDKLTTLNLKT
jgi:hypothetical protein